MNSEARSAMSSDSAVAQADPVSATPVLQAENLHKSFRSGRGELRVLMGINLTVPESSLVAIIGPSGAGKSTLLHLLGALDTPTSGTVYFRGKSLNSLGENELSEFRNGSVGFVWQRHHLLPDFSAVENVAMPLLVRGTPLGEALQQAAGWLDEVGLAERRQHRAGELSGGEQQRVAIARALVSRPAMLLADEPTGDLDEENAETIFELMRRLHQAHQLTLILATHNLVLARRAGAVYRLEHGILAEVSLGPGGANATGEAGTHV